MQNYMRFQHLHQTSWKIALNIIICIIFATRNPGISSQTPVANMMHIRICANMVKMSEVQVRMFFANIYFYIGESNETETLSAHIDILSPYAGFSPGPGRMKTSKLLHNK